MRERLEQAGVAAQEAPNIPLRTWFSTRDPFNNRIEIMVVEGDYREEEA